jgi:predicted permease
MRILIYAGRRLRQDLVFSAAIIGTLALGIGTVTAVVAVADAALIKAVPFRSANRVYYAHGLSLPPSGDRLSWFRQSTAVEDVAEYRSGTVLMSTPDGSRQVSAAEASSSLFTIAAAKPLSGRLFVESDEVPSSAPVVILSRRLALRLGSDSQKMVGSTVILDSEPYTVVGVAPRDFSFPPGIDLWICRQVGRPRSLGTAASLEESGYLQAGVIVRAKSDASEQLVQEQLSVLQRRQEEEAHRRNAQMAVGSIVLLSPITDALTGRQRQPIQLLALAAALVLVTACATVIIMQLSRLIGRRRELAMQFVLGASATRVFSELVTETLLLTSVGGVLGLFVASSSIAIARGLAPYRVWGIDLADATVDLRVVLITAITVLMATIVIAAVCGLQVALLPRVMRTDRVFEWAPRARALRRTLVIIELGVAYVLVLVSTLTLRSAIGLVKLDAGFKPSGVLTADIVVAPSVRPSRVVAGWANLVAALQKDPRVDAVGLVDHVPLTRSATGRQWYQVEGAQLSTYGSDMAYWVTANVRVIGGNYFRALGISQYLGDFTPGPETEDGIIINRAFAEHYWPHDKALGRRVQINGKWTRVSAIVGDIKASRLSEGKEPQVYLVRRQFAEREGAAVIRVRSRAVLSGQDIQDYLRRTDANFALVAVKGMDDVVLESIAPQRLRAFSVAAFSSIAVLLALGGVTTVAAHTTRQRRREFAVRVALGAGATQLLLNAWRETAVLIVLGLSLGLCSAPFLLRASSRLLPEAATEYTVLGFTTCCALAFGAVAATYLPIRAVVSVDPAAVIREHQT